MMGRARPGALLALIGTILIFVGLFSGIGRCAVPGAPCPSPRPDAIALYLGIAALLLGIAVLLRAGWRGSAAAWVLAALAAVPTTWTIYELLRQGACPLIADPDVAQACLSAFGEMTAPLLSAGAAVLIVVIGAIRLRASPPMGAMVLAALAAILLAAPVRADHGFWPAGAVEPAKVAGHASSTSVNTNAGYRGTGCTTHDAGDAAGPGLAQFDVYGAVLARGYGVAVVVGREASSGAIIDGPNALTIFLYPEAGEFLWADTDGDSRFRNDQSADTGTLYLCDAPSLPATDTGVDVGDPGGAPSDGGLASLLLVLAALALVVAANRPGRRASDGRGRH